ncbi:CRISPR-associated endoribonuclease Cas6 [Chitinophaga solisilvae]|uniref:CRISPR-associated endoribonuclease Cas6 n=1 Tax=Chitinophaga solisilvae TaxID=1233460 RepID=UPI0013722981|nr:CRISPR-associated endoribonuclease Cas6 [Chitinophaga solisilvae]
MRFAARLLSVSDNCTIPINYSYPLSAAIYRILANGDKEYAEFLHERGYGKGFKLFSFSQINCPFRIEGDRLRILGRELSFFISFHLPQAAESFITGLFQSEVLVIADRKSRAEFRFQRIERLPDSLSSYQEKEVVEIKVKPLSPVVTGLQDERGYYNFLSPDDSRFNATLMYNWRSKIASSYDESAAREAAVSIICPPFEKPPKSRLITIKANTLAETKIRGWMNFELMISGQKCFVDLLINSGVGLYNGQGMGYVS